MSKKQVKPNVEPTPAEDMNQELLRAMLVSNEALHKACEMLGVMNKILTKMLEQRPVFTIMDKRDNPLSEAKLADVPFKPSETPTETIEALAMKAATGSSPADLDNAAKFREPSPLDEPKGPTLADLKKALQDCIAAHDQETARKCIAPYPTYSLVPLDKLPEVIARVEAATRSVVP